MEDKFKYEKLNELMKKNRIETKEAVNYLREVSRIYTAVRGEHLRKKELRDAKRIHDKLANIYLKVANKVSDEEVKQSLETFAFYWLRSGETEIFIEPSLPKQVHEATKKLPERSTLEEPMPVLPTVAMRLHDSEVSNSEEPPIMKISENLGTDRGYQNIGNILNLGGDIL